MGIKHKNDATGLLASGINDIVTSIPLTGGHGARFPALGAADYFYATLIDSSDNREVVKVTARATDTLTVVRGQDGSLPRTYVAGDRLELRPCIGMLESMDQEAIDVIAASGTDTYTGTMDPVPNGYNTDQIYFVKFPNANTIAAPTLNLNSYGVKTIKKPGGGNLVVGDISAGMVGILHYDGTDMILQNPGILIGGVISPAQITASQNNYNPTGLATAQQLRINSDARWNVTGMVASHAFLWVHNVGAFPIVFTYEDALSTAANRFAFGCTLGGGQSMFLWYDATSARWRAMSLPEPIGTVKDFGTATMPAGYLALTTTPQSRTSFAALFNEIGTTWGPGDGSTTFNIPPPGRHKIGAGTPTEAANGVDADVDIATDRLTVQSNLRKWRTGMAVVFNLTSGTITGLVDDTTYYVIRVSATQIALASSLANAQNGTVINMTAKSSPVWDIAWTGEARTLGESGGEDDHPMTITELLSHFHTITIPSQPDPGGGAQIQGPAGAASQNPTFASDSKGGNAAMNVHSPFKVVTEGIRYV